MLRWQRLTLGVLVTAVAEGVATITASAGEASGSAVVPVMQPVASVQVSPSAETIGLGSTLQLTAEAFDENGEAVAGVEFSWESSDAAVAAVDAGGLVTGVAEGTATITASAGSGQGTAEITVGLNPDRATLVALYEATDGPNWVNNDNWLTDAPLGEWYGVETDAHGRVVQIDLGPQWDGEANQSVSNGLAGPIPPEIGSLANLERLDLDYNNLVGPIPSELGSLANLKVLILGANKLFSPIPPELGHLANLDRLDLRASGLTGALPPELGGLANLGNLNLRDNYLTGPIPPELGRLAKLRYLNLNFNELTGPIPPELGDLASATVLSIAGNYLSGPIPSELGNLGNLTGLDLAENNLSGPIPPQFGNLANLESLQLLENNLIGPIPPELGDLTDLKWLGLHGNHLSGPIPPELGSLANLEQLVLVRNSLTGIVPSTLLRLDRLNFFSFNENEDLCAPGTTGFVSWLQGIEHTFGPYCNESDAGVLEILHGSSGGSGWTNSTGWLATPALEEWHGVTTDPLGRVVSLDLSRNGLDGRLQADFGRLDRITRLWIGGNALSGRLPESLVRLALVEFDYADTSLCTPAEAEFRAWLDGLPSHHGTGEECGPSSDSDVLVALYNATGGQDWTDADNWLTDAPLGNWYGVEVDGEGRVTSLTLWRNALAGSIPPELGNLSHLTNLTLGGTYNVRARTVRQGLAGPIPIELGALANLESLILADNNLNGAIPREFGVLSRLGRLDLSNNGLTGAIPRELGNAESLWTLDLANNDLNGTIPRELGALSRLGQLDLSNNDLTGAIPRELGNAESLWTLDLANNDLNGTIPRELGALSRLGQLDLSNNDLTGPVPPELGNLATLEALLLNFNDLTGLVRPELGRLASLKELGLTDNAGMSGPLPASLTDLRSLETLQAGGTDLCSPQDPDFEAWLETVPRRRIAPCAGAGASTAYLTQAVQSREFPVPLVAGEDILLRVFVTAARTTTEHIPPVRARFYLEGEERHVADIPTKRVAIPTEVDESDLSKSANAEIPGDIVQPGLEMVIEIDPDGTLPAGLGVAKRIPETGRMAIDVRDMPVLDLTLIPFLWRTDPDPLIVELTRDMAADPDSHELLLDTRTLLPVSGLDVKTHEPVMSSSNGAFAILSETRVIRALEGGSGHYMGMMSRPVTEGSGAAPLGGRSSFSVPSSEVIAHELGHNMSLQHAPCGPAGDPDPSFPHPDGSIGAWGFDPHVGGGLVPPRAPDLMSYCGPKWISDYHFTNALRFRLSDEGASGAAAITAPVRSLVLWGGIDHEGVPFLEPAFVVDAPPALPESSGSHSVTGRTAEGDVLFSISFDMAEVADGDGSSSFAFVLPVQPAWADKLAAITLDGPGGLFTLDRESASPMAIRRDPRTGQVRGILRDLPPAAQAARDAAGSIAERGLEVLFSRGIPDAAAWRR